MEDLKTITSQSKWVQYIKMQIDAHKMQIDAYKMPSFKFKWTEKENL